MDIKIYIVDDYAIVRDGMKILLENKQGLTVVGASMHKNDILQKLGETCPDIVILNFSGRVKGGTETVKEIKKHYPLIKTIIIVTQTNNEEIIKLLRIGAAGCILAEHAGNEVVNAIHAVCNGQRYLTRKISEKLVEDYINKAKTILYDNSPLFSLSIREKEVLQLVVEGKTSSQIAKILCISLRTVNTYRYRVMEKLNIDGIPGLVKFAIQNGLTPE